MTGIKKSKDDKYLVYITQHHFRAVADMANQSLLPFLANLTLGPQNSLLRWLSRKLSPGQELTCEENLLPFHSLIPSF